MSSESIIKLARTGTNLIINSSASKDTLIKIANEVKRGGGHLTIRGRKGIDILLEIASICPERITFDISE